MKSIWSIVFIFVSSICFLCTTASKEVITHDPYNLSFNPNKHTWQTHLQSVYGQVVVDSYQVINGKYPLLIKKTLLCSGWNNSSISQRIILPRSSSNTIHPDT